MSVMSVTVSSGHGQVKSCQVSQSVSSVSHVMSVESSQVSQSRQSSQVSHVSTGPGPGQVRPRVEGSKVSKVRGLERVRA